MAEALIRLIADGLVLPVVVIGAGALIIGIPNDQKYRAYCRILMAGLTAYLAAKLLGAVYQPADGRPFELLGLTPSASFLDNPGFPSDHVLFCMAIALAVWYETRYKKVAIALFALTIAVGIGRVLAFVHSPLDVVGALLIACAGIPWYLQREPGKRKTAAEPRQKHKKRVK